MKLKEAVEISATVCALDGKEMFGAASRPYYSDGKKASPDKCYGYCDERLYIIWKDKLKTDKSFLILDEIKNPQRILELDDWEPC